LLRDAIGRDWQCGTTQVDFNLPERFGAFYIDADGEKKQPVMVHSRDLRLAGALTGILIEHFAGHFPLWLAPVQGWSAPFVSDADSYAGEVAPRAPRRMPVELDLPREINYKVREHSLAKVPVLLVIGKKEPRTGRCRSGGWGARSRRWWGLRRRWRGWSRRRWRRMCGGERW